MAGKTLLGICIAMSMASIAAAGALQVGAGSVVITPEEPMWMAGYASRSGPAEGKLQDLYAKAMVFEDETGAKSAIVTTDLLGLPAQVSKAAAEVVEERYGIPRDRLMLTSSHTHCGPAIRDSLEAMYALEEAEAAKMYAYSDKLPGLLADAVGQAIENIEPCQVRWGIGECGFAMNRREYTPGGVINGRNPVGPVDHDVPTLAALREDGSVKAVLFGYACHNTTLSFMQWSGDYAGFAQEHIQTAMPDTTALFVMGCGGDANPLPRRSVELAQKYGKELGESVLTVLGGDMAEVTGPVHPAYKEVPLKLTPAPTREQVEADLKDDNVYIQRRAGYLLEKMDEQGGLSETYPFPIQVWQFGDSLQLTALGGEVVVDYAIRLKYEIGREKQFVIAYANDVCCYIPSIRVLMEGGYEGDSSMIYYGFYGPWDRTIEGDIMATVHELTELTAKKE